MKKSSRVRGRLCFFGSFRVLFLRVVCLRQLHAVKGILRVVEDHLHIGKRVLQAGKARRQVGGQRGDLRGMNGKNSFPTDHRRHRLRQIPDRAQSFLQGRGRGTHLDQQGAFCVLLIEACGAQIDVPA